jgi:hypothetical protein
MRNPTSDTAEQVPSEVPIHQPDHRPRLQFSMAMLFWVIGAVGLLLGLTTSGGFTGLVVAVSLLLVILVWRTAPASTWFQKSLVMLVAWGGAVFGWRMLDSMGTIRFLGWRAEADVVSAVASGTLALAIAAYLVLYKR